MPVSGGYVRIVCGVPAAVLPLPARLLLADRRAARVFRSAGTGLSDRADSLRRNVGGPCHGLHAGRVHPGAGGAAFGTGFG